MQNQNQAQNFLNWKLASKFIQFAFEQVVHGSFRREDEDEENLENGSPRKTSKHEEQEQDQIQNSYEPSNQVIDFQRVGEQNQVLEISNFGKVVVDEVSRTCVFASKAYLPAITVNFKHDSKPMTDVQGISQKSKYIELFLAQKSHSSQYQKYKIIKGGLKGSTRHKVKKQSATKFQKIKFNYISIPQKLPRLILAVYQQTQNKRTYRSVMISEEFSIIQNHKILTIQNVETLKPYFQSVSPTFLDKTGGILNQKIILSNKHKIIQEMGTFQNYLIKKNKKIWNIVYAAYKYAHIVDLYFYNPQNKPKKQQFLQLWKQVIQSFRVQQTGQYQKTCNYLNPNAKFILKINFPMRTVRFIINREHTKYLSIIATQNQLQTTNKWVKFDDITQMKQVFIQCHNEIQAKLISQPLITKTSAINSSQQQQSSPPMHDNKKTSHHQKNNEDEDFNQQDIQDEDDDVEYQGQSSQNYSMSNRKRGRKAGQKKTQDIKKLGNGVYNRQNKYTTRGVNRTKNKQDTQDSNDKKANMLKKNKQKQMLGRPPVQGNPVTNPPFRVLTPSQAGQYKDQQTQAIDANKMIGIIPMGMNPSMMGMKKQDGKPKQMGIPMMMPAGMNPQMMAMMGGGSMPQGMQMVPMGNGMQAIMMPVQMDKNQGNPQPTMNGMQIPGMSAMGMPGMTAMGGMPGMGGMMPMMMGGAGGMPQGFMMPASMLAAQQQAQNQKSKTDADKQKQSDKKDDNKKQTNNNSTGFPPQAMQAVDLSKMGLMGQMPAGMSMMPNGQLGMSMPQLMQMGMPGLNPAMMGSAGMPQGIMMNPMMMQKPNSQSKQQNGSKQNSSATMQNPLFGGQMPFMMAQMPSQLQSQTQGSSQNNTPNISNIPNMASMAGMPGMQLGMMGGQFPQMMQMGGQANPSMQGNHGQGMPMGGYMMLNQQQLRQLPPAQQMQIQMQLMMKQGMMPGMMQMPKNDGNDGNKK